MAIFTNSGATVNGEGAAERAKRLYEQLNAQENESLLQRILLIGSIKSSRFYHRIKPRLCPLLAAGRGVLPGSRRKDFDRDDHNAVFDLTAKIWDSFPPSKGNTSLPFQAIQTRLHQERTRGREIVSPEGELAETWLLRELEQFDVDQELLEQLPTSPVFLNWLKRRVLKDGLAHLSNLVHEGREATEADLKELYTQVEQICNDGLPPIVDAVEFMAKKLNKPAELVAGLLHQGSKMLLSGGSKTFKTWLLLSLALSVASGEPWLTFATKQGRVLYLNFEIQEPFIQERFDLIARAKGITLKPGQIDIWNLRGFSASHKTILPKILEHAKNVGYVLIVIDPIYKIYDEQTDENSTKDIAHLMRSIEMLVVETGAAVVFGGHYSKGNQAGREAIDRTSGSGVYGRDPDTILTFTTHTVDEALTVEATLRNFKPIKPFVVRWQWPLMVRDGSLDPKQIKQAGGKGRQPSELLEVLPVSGIRTEAFRRLVNAELGIAKTQFYEFLQSLRSTGQIVKENDLWLPAKGSSASVSGTSQ